MAEVRDDRAAAGHTEAAHRNTSSRVATPSGEPSEPTTSERVTALGDEDRERIAQARVRRQPREAVLASRRRELELAERPQRERLERPVAADEVRHELVHRMLEDLHRRVVLREPAALAQDRDAVADLDRLVDVVRDEDHRLAQLLLQAEELVLQPSAHDRVDRAERLVHQHQRRVGGERTRKADALALTAGELRGEALRVGRIEADEVEQLGGARLDPRARPAEQPRNRADVPLDRHVREEPDLLDDVADRAAQLGQVVVADRPAVDADVAARELDQPVDELERRRLAAARRPDEDADVSRRHGEREMVDRRALPARVDLRGLVEDELGRRGRHG